MAFDWIAGTALVVGIGSLYLTYQSTKAAKKAIDTSIELYEKQKEEGEIRERKIKELKFLGMECTIGLLADDVIEFLNNFYSVFESKKNKIHAITLIEKDSRYYFGRWNDKNEIINAVGIELINVDVYYHYIFEASCIDGKCLHDLVRLLRLYSAIERVLRAFIISIEGKNRILYEESNASGHKELIDRLRGDIRKIIDSLNVQDLDSFDTNNGI